MDLNNFKHLKSVDPDIFKYVQEEEDRQEQGIELIASENYTSKAVMEAQGSILTNKYAEGYPKKRYYGGCEFVDQIEQLAIDRIKKLFNAEFANVQPHSGSQANMASFFSLLTPGDTIMGMDLSEGGHLTHGSPVNFSGKLFDVKFYGLNPETELLDYEKLEQLAHEYKPKLIIAGASAYPRAIDFKKFSEIAKSVGAYLLVDMAHIAGLVAAGLHPSPMEYADIVTSTTHKTLRGPRGGIILTNNEALAKKINSNIFPGIQGGPLEHVIAAKAVAFKEALDPCFVTYQKQVISNAKVFAKTLMNMNVPIITNGTDNHLILVNTIELGLTGKEAEKLLESAKICCNKNMIPKDQKSPFVTSGIRLGTPAITTRGFKEEETEKLAMVVGNLLKNAGDKKAREDAIKFVDEVATKLPVYPS